VISENARVLLSFAGPAPVAQATGSASANSESVGKMHPALSAPKPAGAPAAPTKATVNAVQDAKQNEVTTALIALLIKSGTELDQSTVIAAVKQRVDVSCNHRNAGWTPFSAGWRSLIDHCAFILVCAECFGSRGRIAPVVAASAPSVHQRRSD